MQGPLFGLQILDDLDKQVRRHLIIGLKERATVRGDAPIYHLTPFAHALARFYRASRVSTRLLLLPNFLTAFFTAGRERPVFLDS
jgi:hypothetical protein